MSAPVLRRAAPAAMTVVTAIGFMRVFDGGSFLVPLIGVALVAHVAAALTRRLPTAISAPVMAVVGVLVCTEVTHWGATTSGVPTPFTFEEIGRHLTDAADLVAHQAAPVTPAPGLVLVAALVLWLVAWSADRLTFTYDAPFEAVVPTATVFVVVTALAGNDPRWLPVALYAATVAVHVLVARHSTPVVDPTTAGERIVTWRPIIRGGAIAAVTIAVGLGAAATVPALQFPGTRPIHRDRTVEVTPPLIDLHDQFVDPTDVEMFRVKGGGPHYWRLTAYDEFDGSRWKMSPSNSTTIRRILPVDDRYPDTVPATRTTSSFDLTGLGGTFAPGAFRPAFLTGRPSRSGGREVPDVRWDDTNAALLVGTGDGGVEGLSYELASDVPAPTAEELRVAHGPVPPGIERYTDLPPDTLERLAPHAEAIVGQRTNPYAQALALQQFFRDGFTYSTDVRGLPGTTGTGDDESTDAVLTFLRTRVGYCVHFAGAYAALARSLGIPARVAVGFTPGEYDEVHGTYVVRGRNAHVWPEVYFAGVGWLPFEPSPGRGNHDALSYTGVNGISDPNRGPDPVEPVDPGEDPTVPSTEVPRTVPPAPPVTPAPGGPTPPQQGPPAPVDTSPGGLPVDLRILGFIGLVAILLAIGPVVRLLRRASRRRRAREPARRVRLAWGDTLDAWGRLGLRRMPSETERDIGDRIAAQITALVGTNGPAAEAHRLAGLATAAAWNAPAVTPRDVTEAEAIAARLTRVADDHRSRRSRVLGWFDPRNRDGDA